MLRYDFCSIIYYILLWELIFYGIWSSFNCFHLSCFHSTIGIVKVHVEIPRALKIFGRWQLITYIDKFSLCFQVQKKYRSVLRKTRFPGLCCVCVWEILCAFKKAEAAWLQINLEPPDLRGSFCLTLVCSRLSLSPCYRMWVWERGNGTYVQLLQLLLYGRRNEDWIGVI